MKIVVKCVIFSAAEAVELDFSKIAEDASLPGKKLGWFSPHARPTTPRAQAMQSASAVGDVLGR